MKKSIFLLTFTLLHLSLSAKDYNVKAYGAVSDGKTLTSDAFNKAIEDAVRNGGGRVIVPAGD